VTILTAPWPAKPPKVPPKRAPRIIPVSLFRLNLSL